MNPSDFLTLLGLAFAVWAIIPRKERRFILLFFSNLEIVLFVFSLFFIHFLMSFEWLLINWFPFLSFFTLEKSLPSTTWAYSFALLIIFYPIIKVNFGYFSKSRIKNTVLLYETYLKENEIDLLVNYINKYHINDIEMFLQSISNLHQEDSLSFDFDIKKEKDKSYEKLIRSKRMMFAASVYGHIIQDEFFIKNAANKYPELFATVINGMESNSSTNQELVKLYLDLLYNKMNQYFIKELKIITQHNSSILEMNREYNLPILISLMGDTKAAVAKYVWYPIGEGGIKSLKYDMVQKEFLIKKYCYDLESEFWSQKIHIAIVYIHYMVRETIYRNSEWHMWLFYYTNFTELLTDLIPEEDKYDESIEYPTFAHKMISNIFDNMLDWLELAKEKNTKNRVIDTIRCLGHCVYTICQTDDKKISKLFRRKLLDSVLRIYFQFSNEIDNIGAETSRLWFEKMFINPRWVDRGIPDITGQYLSAFKDVWRNFDRVPFQDFEDNGSIQQFEKNVVEILLSDK
jgi:hypothetical protein